MTDKRPSKRYKTIHSWFQSETPPSGSENVDVSETNVNVNSANDISLAPSVVAGECGQTSGERTENFDITSLERDPGLRRSICQYPLNERDNVRRAYVILGPCQPELSSYPSSFDTGQGRKFNYKWFKVWPWLEYSVNMDKAYCFPCFVFDSYPSHHPAFTENGFQGWKNAMSKSSGMLNHMGGINSTHNDAMHKWEVLRNPSKQIERVIITQSSKEIATNRLRLIATIESIRLLANQGCALRGNDESVDSLNAGNFHAVLNSFGRMNLEVQGVLDNAPGNAKYTSPTIQRQIANILGNKVRAKIREEIGVAKFCILVDEALDASNKEQMAIILRFVDCLGFIKERFFKVTSVADTCSLTLKNEISKVLTQYDLQVENMRGQGYDGASNMRGEFNGLQALFLEECPYAYYVHCFAHRLQLTLNAAAKEVLDVHTFFSTLNFIVNFVDSSAKRHLALKVAREDEIADLVAAGKLQTGTGANQACTLQRAGATRWGSHLRSITSLVNIFTATSTTLADLVSNGPKKVQADAKNVGKAMKHFNFVFCLLMMQSVMKITDLLCQSLQKKALDILNALNFLKVTRKRLQHMREHGWKDLITNVASFCNEHGIIMPDMSAPYKKSVRACEEGITNEHYYRVNILNAVIDFQLSEMDTRFGDTSLELLVLSSSFDPHDSFASFKSKDVCYLASKFYPGDFTSHDMATLDMECGFFIDHIQGDPRFDGTTCISDLCQQLVKSRRSDCFPMIYRLLCLVLTLPVSTATTERAFSSMNIIKSRLRNKMEDELLNDLMVLYIEREFADSIDNNSVIKEFELSGNRRVRFS